MKLELVPIDTALNSVIESLTYFFKIGSLAWYQENQQNLRVRVKIFLKCLLWSVAAKLKSAWTKLFLQEIDQEPCRWKRICQILILTFWLMIPPLFPAKNSPNSAESNRVLSEGKGNNALILTDLDSPMAEVFPERYLFFRFRPCSGRNEGSKLDQKCKLWIRSFSANWTIFKGVKLGVHWKRQTFICEELISVAKTFVANTCYFRV